MIAYPAIDPVLLKLGVVQIRWYGLMYAVAFGIAWRLARARAEVHAFPPTGKHRWLPREVDDLIFMCALGVIVGGRLGWVLFYGLEDIWRQPQRILFLWTGGMSFHGGLLGVLIASGWFARTRQKRVSEVFDFIAPLPGLGILAVRIANFINGELWGKPTSLPWGFKLVASDLHPQQAANLEEICKRFIVQPCEVVLHATQLYEGLLEGLVTFIIVWWYSRRPRPPWTPSGLFLVCYGLARFSIEFLRIPDSNRPYFFDGWGTMGQLLSLPLIVGGTILITIAHRAAPRQAVVL